jgi:hypothetical protein
MAVLFMAVPITVSAQGGGASSTGSISGQVVDAGGGALPGVTVKATSPAQIGTLTAVTNEEGTYRFPAVPPGTYRLEFGLSGFQTLVREGIRVALGLNAAVAVTLPVASVQESVTVSGESPVVDPSTTRLQTNYDRETLASLPNARDMWSLLGATPSIALARVDVGGSTAGTQTNYFAYGYFGQNRPLIEGINTTEGTSAAGFYLDYGSFEEVFIGAAGNSAEMPNPGVLTQFVGRSGGARLSANVYFDYENDRIQSRNLPEEATIPSPGATIRPDGNRLASYNNLNLSVGGPILPERLWGYFAYMKQQNSIAAPPSGSILDAFRHQAVQLHRQSHIPVEPAEQVHRLHPAWNEATAASDRFEQPARRARTHPRRLDGVAGFAQLGLQRGMERHADTEPLCRVPRRPVRVQLRARQQHRRHPLRVADDERDPGRRT